MQIATTDGSAPSTENKNPLIIKNTGGLDGTVPNTNDDNGSGNGNGSGSVSSYRRTSTKKKYESPTLPSATSQADYINSIYSANEQNAIDKLTSAYDQNVLANQREAEKLPGTYNTAANDAASQDAIARQRFNVQSAASGLNSGAGSQAQLSMNNALASNISNIRKAQSDAQADLDYQRLQLETEYKNAIRQAIAENNTAKAQALYEEAKRVDESLVSTAVNQANMDFSVWKALYK